MPLPPCFQIQQHEKSTTYGSNNVTQCGVRMYCGGGGEAGEAGIVLSISLFMCVYIFLSQYLLYPHRQSNRDTVVANTGRGNVL